MAALTPAKVIVTAKDSSGNALTTGGDTFFVMITNQCTKENTYICLVNSGAANTLSAPIQGVMTDHTNGTYSYTYTLTVTGKIEIVKYA